MLDASLKAQLAAYLQRISQPVEITAVLDDTPASREMQALLRDIAEASPLVRVTETREPGGPHRTPSFAVNRPGENHGPRFAGLPMGHEFTSLVLALLQIGGYPPKVEQDVLEQIRALDQDLEFEVYVSLTCHNCPDVVQALNLMAVQNPRIKTTMVEGSLFQDEIEQRQIMGVPTVFLNGTMFGTGRMSLEEILAKVDASGTEREAKKIAAKDPFDVLIVGGGPAGAAAAVYAARKGIRTGVASERFGGQVLDTLGIENFVSVKETEGPKFALALEEHVRHYDVDIMNLQRAKALKPGADLIEVELENGAALKARSVILSTGARWRQLGVPGEQQYRNKGVAYCPHCDGPLFKGKRVAVIGGGNSGVEAAIDLAGIVGHVTLLEFADQLRADAVLQRKLASLPNVTTILNAQTTEVTGDGQKVNGLVYKDRASGEDRRIELEGVFVQIGLVPNTEWLKGTLELSRHGEIIVDAKGQTSVPGVFAAGDATTVPFKQIIIAAGDGAKAALGAFDHLIRTSAPA
ncbi:MAG TPA: alkyl hydroperoxide reductase subunit F [Ramlibacter sp.]|jgi:alkyl hydroperoxide reductase subunit F|uniref:alkyl hydroperoxide reductase subunit F n=1 Tax=Ramlibacter sp. TaxID=1917967 RepID=UPI002D61681A|nr:alkyl hydroperoxide reductase subunit F [Ramlibacter sp.]HZY19369.1 alkyl hydroperoxide reductase subunit F [Ramlibacter sp.]